MALIQKKLAKICLVSICSLLTLSLAGCDDDDKIATAAKISVDGQSAAEALTKYFNATADTLNAQCDMENFTQAFSLISKIDKKLISAEEVYEQYKKCQSDTARMSYVKELQQWAKSSQKIGNIYAALLNVTAAKNSSDSEAALNSLSDEVASATKTTMDPKVKASLSYLTDKLVRHKEAKTISEFGNLMANVPRALYEVLEQEDNAAKLDAVYVTYDQLLDRAILTAYSKSAADPTPQFDAFYSRMGVKLPASFPKDPALMLFAMSVRAQTLSINGKQLRQSSIDLLKTVYGETVALNTVRKSPSSLKDDVADFKQTYKEIYDVIHPKLSSATTK